MFKIIQKLAPAPPTGQYSHVAPLRSGFHFWQFKLTSITWNAEKLSNCSHIFLSNHSLSIHHKYHPMCTSLVHFYHKVNSI